jgi:amino acid transporter
MNGYFENQIKKKKKEIRKWGVISAVWFICVCFGFLLLVIKLPRPMDFYLPWWVLLPAPICMLPLIVIIKKGLEIDKIKKEFHKTDPRRWKEFVEKQKTLQ